MRLIDADLLTEEIESLRCTLTGLRAGKGVLARAADEYRKSILQIISDQPTAFDKEKVIRELSKKRYEALKMRDDENTSCTTELKSFWHSRLEAYTLAIEVIEKGGIE